MPEHPLRPNADPRTIRGSHYFNTIARLKPGVTLVQARADLETVAQRIGREHPDSEAGNGLRLTTLREETVGDVRAALLILLGAVGLVLLIACANVANLQLARGTVRRKEMAVRSALGASRRRVVRQLLTESVLLSILGGGLGVFLAVWGFGPLVSLVPQEIRANAHLTLDRPAFAFTVILSILTGFIFGLIPAFQSSQMDLNAALKEGGRNPSEGQRGRIRDLLVMGEIALAMVLLSGAGLLVKSFLRLEGVEHGFNPQNVLTMRISLASPSYADASKKASFVEQIIERIERLPGVLSAAVVARLPLNPGSSARSISIEGRPTSPNEELSPDYNVISPDYFATLGIPLLKGRRFEDSDAAGGQPVVIINRTMARHYWPGQDAVGKRLKIGGDQNWREVVGVAGDVKQHALSEPSRPMMYVPYAQDPWPSLTVAVRTAVDPAALTSLAKHEIQAVDKSEPVYDVRTLEEVVSASVAPRRFNTLLLGLFAAFALILAGVGTYGVVSYTVARRTHEIGLRMALGAGRRDVLRLVVGRGMLLAAGGLAAGLVAALGLTRFLSSLLYGVRPADPATLVAGLCFLAGVALAASYVPARRAAKVDPMVALRCE